MADEILPNKELNDEFTESLSSSNDDYQRNLLNIALYGTGTAVGLGMTGKYGKRAAARAINTLGFGNVAGSYQSNPKPVQYIDDLFTAAGGKRRSMIGQFAGTLAKSGRPAELSAAVKSIDDLENYMSKIRSQGGRISAKLKNFYLNSVAQLPERRMAQAILQRSLNQPINFSHGGIMIEGTMPQQNPHIAKALTDKGLNINKPLPVMDVSDDKQMISKLRGGQTSDPRIKYITKLLKQNRVNEAKSAASKGLMEYKGEVVRSGAGQVQFFKDGQGRWVTKSVPHYLGRGGKLSPYKEYVIGGHTQMTTFGNYKGHTGFHKVKTDVFDITTYRSQGENMKTATSIPQKIRVGLAGPAGQAAGIHTPVVTQGTYKHNAPGGGRAPGATDKVPRKLKKYVESGSRTYSKAFDLIKKYGWKGAKAILTKGRKF